MANETSDPETKPSGGMPSGGMPSGGMPSRGQREHKWAILAGFMFAGVALASAYFVLFAPKDRDIPDRELSDAEITNLLRLTRLPFLTEPAAEEIVMNFGLRGIPFLSAVLRTSDTPPRVQGNICIILGVYRQGDHTPEMIDSLERNLIHDMTAEHRTGVVSTMSGLGYSGEAKAMAFLEKLAGQAYWDELPVTLSRVEDSPGDSESQSSDKMVRLFRDRAIRSLGFAPAGAGAAALKRLAGTLPDNLEVVRTVALSESRRRKWRINELTTGSP